MKKIFLLLLFLCSNAFASLTDVKFGRYQIADSQWNVSACLYTTTCQIYSKQPGVAYKIPWTSGQVQWATGDYVKFELSGNASFPYTAKQYNSAGWLIKQLQSRYNDSTSKVIIGHSDIAIPRGRKLDPGLHFDWEKLHVNINKWR